MEQLEQFLALIEKHTGAIVALLLVVAGLLLILQWLMWIFGYARFHRTKQLVTPGKPQNIRYLITEGLVKIINDFRHLLALLLVIIFALALCWTLYQAGGNIPDIKEVLQTVIATLGGLVGTIMGYYFGEAAGRQQSVDAVSGGGGPPVAQELTTPLPSEIKPVPPPKEIQGPPDA